MATNVYITDTNLVFLYRFETFTEDERLLNVSQSPVYTGYNTMSVSGAPAKDANIPSAVPDGSGVKFDSGLDMFHLPVTSGNQSGVEVASGMSFSFGFFGRLGFLHANDRTWLAKHSSATSGSYFRIHSSSGGTNFVRWALTLGRNSGSSTLSIPSPNNIDTTLYESVIATVNSTSDIAILYVSGIPVASSTLVQFSPGPSGWDQFPTRIGAHRSFTDQANANALGLTSGLIAEAFFMNRLLSQEEVSGIYLSGFISAPAAPVVSGSDSNDSQKDNLGSLSSTTPTISVTAWNANDLADPSGYRHIASGLHPAFIKLLNTGVTSGLVFTRALKGSPSNPVAITFRNTTSGTYLSGVKFWLSDYSAFGSNSGWNVAQHINSRWIPNLVLPSGSGTVGQSLSAASSVFRSDGGLTISGIAANVDDAPSGEPQVSQYIYVAFVSDNNLPIGTYGPNGFRFRITSDF